MWIEQGGNFMSENQPPNLPPRNLPPLGRLLGVIERHFFKALVVAAIVVLALGFIIPMHGEFEIEEFGGFFAAFGFASLIVLLVVARLLRVITARPEDYYGTASVNAEEYPADQVEVIDHDV